MSTRLGTTSGSTIRRGRPRLPKVSLSVVVALAVAGSTAVLTGVAGAKDTAPTTTTTTAPAPTTTAPTPTTTAPAPVGTTGVTDAKGTAGWLLQVALAIKADKLWDAGWTGRDVDVALIDTGVAPVPGENLLVNGPDLSYEGQDPELRYLDGYGHGTHMAGIINGSDPHLGPDPTKARLSKATSEQFIGIAPGARIVNVRVGNSDGTADVSQVIAGINWVIENRNKDGLKIRVLNLSFGTDSVQPYQQDPLAYAVEAAWKAGIVVVAAAGNSGFGTADLNMPALDPYVIAVGASDQHGTTESGDDTVAAFSNPGTASRRPDVLAPGTTTYSLRVPGSFLDEMYPEARIGDRMFRGSGTSEAAAVVSGAVALMLQHDNGLTPSQVKAKLMGTGKALPLTAGSTRVDPNQRLIDVSAAALDRTSKYPVQPNWAPATGTGSIDMSRGTSTVEQAGIPLAGEIDVFGRPWNPSTWASQTAAGTTWAPGGYWEGLDIAGPEWSPDRWTGRSWRTGDWTGRSWRTDAWTGRSWRTDAWTGRSWRTDAWTGRSWRGESWTGRSWRGESWTGSASGDGAVPPTP